MSESVSHLATALGGDLLKANLLGAPLPTLDGRYRFAKILGRGATGMVVRAHDQRLAREVAVKLAPTSVLSQRMLDEARALARLKRPECVVQVWETASGYLASSTYTTAVNYIVMELVVGKTLREWQQQGPALGELLNVYANVAVGLHRVHSASLVHGDVKPDNVIVDANNVPTLVDFGFATSMLDSGVGWRDDVLGTWPYMGPEVLEGQVGRQSDVHAYAVSLWEALTGALPFEADDARWGKGRLGALPNELAVPRSLREVLKRAMSNVPSQRPRIEEVHAAVLKAHRGLSASRSLPIWATAAALGMGALLVVVVTLAMGGSEESNTPGHPRDTPEVIRWAPGSARAQVHDAEAIGEAAAEGYRGILDAWNAGRDLDAYHAGFEDPVECYYGQLRVARRDVRGRMLDAQFDLGPEDRVRGPHRTTVIRAWRSDVVSPTQVVLYEEGWTDVAAHVVDGRVVGTSGRSDVNRRVELHFAAGRWRVRQEESVGAETSCWLDPVPE